MVTARRPNWSLSLDEEVITIGEDEDEGEEEGEDSLGIEVESTKRRITLAEERARVRQRRKGSRNLRGTERQFAEALREEASILDRKGDYESALVLYHRASRTCPREPGHARAVSRTTSFIKDLSSRRRFFDEVKPASKKFARLSMVPRFESAAIRASEILRSAPDPTSRVPVLLEYFDEWEDFSKGRVEKNHCQRRFGRGTNVASKFDGFASTVLGHLAQGRHDRAVSFAARMTRTALLVPETTNRSVILSRALVILGKVHLSFGHLEAASRAWEDLIPEVTEPVLRAWIFHEIGRCRMESGEGRGQGALEMAKRCLEAAKNAGSSKWILNGQLLLGQSLARMGRLEEAAGELRTFVDLGEMRNAGDDGSIAYARELAKKVAREARRSKSIEAMCSSEPKNRSVKKRKDVGIGDRDSDRDKSECVLSTDRLFKRNASTSTIAMGCDALGFPNLSINYSS